MGRIIRDNRCENCGTVTELWATKEEVAIHPCPKCHHATLVPIIGAPKINYTMSVANGEASSDAMNTSIDKWQKMRDQKQRIEKRNFERHGTYD